MKSTPVSALALALAFATSCGGAQHAVPAADLATREHQLDQLLDEQWQWQLRNRPEMATILGDHRYDDRWTDGSPEAIAKMNADTKDFLARFKAIDTTGFPEQRALDQELMVRELALDVEGEHFEDWLMPTTQQSGPHLFIPQLVSLTRFETVADYEHYLARLHGIPKALAQTTALMRAGAAKHLLPPRILLVQVVPQAQALAGGAPDESPFAQPVAKFPDAIAPAEQARLRAAILAAIKDEVQPAYAQFGTFVANEYAPAGRDQPGEWALPDGDARYAYDVKSQTTTDLTPEQIHALGVSEVARIEAREAEVAKQLGFASLAELRAHVADDPKLHASSREDLLHRYETYIAQMNAKLPELFGHLPKATVKVLPTEAFREASASSAEYEPGTPDGSRPGTVRVNTSEPTKRLIIDAETTAYHEGVPGHHLQIAIQQELGDLPMFRKEGNYTAYAEGWALYAEALGEEVGFYQDPWSLYGHLDDEMLRAIRLVVDTGFHAKHWSRQQVVDYFHAHSSISEVEVQSETDRYIGDPGQALGYKLGQLTILRLRDEAKQQLGASFDIRAFHDQILGAGALPLDVLERRVHAWIARGGR
jgi:uncharacterized protein (DUF885 family)